MLHTRVWCVRHTPLPPCFTQHQPAGELSARPKRLSTHQGPRWPRARWARPLSPLSAPPHMRSRARTPRPSCSPAPQRPAHLPPNMLPLADIAEGACLPEQHPEDPCTPGLPGGRERFAGDSASRTNEKTLGGQVLCSVFQSGPHLALVFRNKHVPTHVPQRPAGLHGAPGWCCVLEGVLPARLCTEVT